MVLAGVAGTGGPTLVDPEAEALRQHLMEAGRRTLGSRAPRRGR